LRGRAAIIGFHEGGAAAGHSAGTLHKCLESHEVVVDDVLDVLLDRKLADVLQQKVRNGIRDFQSDACAPAAGTLKPDSTYSQGRTTDSHRLR